MQVSVKKIDEELSLPKYAHSGDAAFDLMSSIDVDIKPLHRATVPCGFAIEIPCGYAGLVIPRSGLAANHGITVLNSPGLIDSGYRGEIKVILYNSDPESTYSIKRGHRIAQMALFAIQDVYLLENEDLSESERSEGGFGSSGV